MGIIWYFEVISFYYGGEWSTITDTINMLQVWLVTEWREYYHYIDQCAGSLGLPHVCLQEKCLQGDPEEERETLQCRPSEVAD